MLKYKSYYSMGLVISGSETGLFFNTFNFTWIYSKLLFKYKIKMGDIPCFEIFNGFLWSGQRIKLSKLLYGGRVLWHSYLKYSVVLIMTMPIQD